MAQKIIDKSDREQKNEDPVKRNRIFDIVLSLSGLDKEENLKDLMLDLQKENEERLAAEEERKRAMEEDLDKEPLAAGAADLMDLYGDGMASSQSFAADLVMEEDKDDESNYSSDCDDDEEEEECKESYSLSRARGGGPPQRRMMQ